MATLSQKEITGLLLDWNIGEGIRDES